MAIVCYTCGHPGDDHVDNECMHDGPEDRCQDVIEADAQQCQCDYYMSFQVDPDPAP